MCKAIAIINKNSGNNVELNRLLSMNAESLATQSDGYSVWEKGQKAKGYIGKKDYKIENVKKAIEYKGSEVYMTHFRLSTCGADDKNGLHLQEISERYVFAHNGTVSKFSSVEIKNDSYFFFRRLVTKYDDITPKEINKCIKEYGFSGKGFLYDKLKDEFHFFNNMPAYLYIFNEAIVISTWKLELEEKQYKIGSTLGFEWKVEQGIYNIKGIMYQETIDDTILKLNGGMLVEMDKTDKALRHDSIYTYSSGYYSNKRWNKKLGTWEDKAFVEKFTEIEDYEEYCIDLYATYQDDVANGYITQAEADDFLEKFYETNKAYTDAEVFKKKKRKS